MKASELPPECLDSAPNIAPVSFISFAVSLTPSLNRTMAMHWRARERLGIEYDHEIMVAKRTNSYVPIEKWQRRKVFAAICRCSSRAMDMDNFIGGTKQLVDAIKRGGLIHDDSPRWFKAAYAQVKCPQRYAQTRVSLFEILP